MTRSIDMLIVIVNDDVVDDDSDGDNASRKHFYKFVHKTHYFD